MKNSFQPKNNPELQEMLWAEQLGAFDDTIGQRLLQIHIAGASDDLIQGMISERVQRLRMKHALGNLPPFLTPRLTKGELFVQGLHGELIRLPKNMLPKNILHLGQTGSGKTTTMEFFALQLAVSNSNQWLSENYKRRYRHLRPLFRKLGKELIVLRHTNWKFNILQAGRRNLQNHLTMVSDLLPRELDLMGDRSQNILYQGCRELYKKFGNLEGNRTTWPTLHDLYEWIYEHRKLNAAAREAILDRLGALLPAMGPAYRRGWETSDLACHSIVFELAGIPEIAKHLLLSSLLFSALQECYEQGTIHNLVVSFDDCQRIVAQQVGGGDLPTLEELVSVNREGGLCVWLSLQSLEGVSRRLISNLSTRIMAVLGTSNDYQSLGSHMAMNAEQIDWAKLNLKPGMGIMQIADGTWRHPFPFIVPRPKIPSSVDDAQAQRSVAPLNALSVERAREFDRWEPHHYAEISGASSQRPSGLSDSEFRFLWEVVANPGKSASFYAKNSELSGSQAAKVRARLVEGGFLREHKVATGTRGRNAIILEPLESAKTAAAQEVK